MVAKQPEPELVELLVNLTRQVFLPGKIVPRILHIAMMASGKQIALINRRLNFPRFDVLRVNGRTVPRMDTCHRPTQFGQNVCDLSGPPLIRKIRQSAR